jgi:hypothetical protein
MRKLQRTSQTPSPPEHSLVLVPALTHICSSYLAHNLQFYEWKNWNVPVDVWNLIISQLTPVKLYWFDEELKKLKEGGISFAEEQQRELLSFVDTDFRWKAICFQGLSVANQISKQNNLNLELITVVRKSWVVQSQFLESYT